ncbi:MAG TPA: hypothetical protein IGS53_09750 [Leptolyngbyaceae cyanobacterium M33_DOE_097]|uniref:DUF1795 domain-containing protein n=1 Tax=Oscillatoriales cyanobacterium SpSt-418 TaxID=2282169 RepID=A0A7C3PBU9_9CYAN|nr:hypothetical protein [Leptolyngbyaceae cyanobacterium M33_DOE_097]
MKRQQIVSLAVTSVIVLSVAFAKAAVKANRSKAPVSQGQVAQVLNSKSAETVLASSTGKTEVRLAQGWANALTPEAAQKFEMKAKKPIHSLHLSVNAKTRKSLLGMTLEQFAKVPVEGLKTTIKNAQVERTSTTKVNGKSAVQYKVQGVGLGDVDLTMLTTVVETPNSYYTILAGGPTKTFAQHQAELQQAIQSFRELQSTAQAR